MKTITKTYPTVNLPAGVRALRPLGISDFRPMAKIFQAAVERYQAEQGYRLEPVPLNSPEGALRFALGGIEHCDEIATPWLSSLIGLTPESMRDPDVFPLPAMAELVAGVVAHPDLMGFVAAMRRTATSASETLQAVKAEDPTATSGLVSFLGRFQRGVSSHGIR
jgi:hypothetical protein